MRRRRQKQIVHAVNKYSDSKLKHLWHQLLKTYRELILMFFNAFIVFNFLLVTQKHYDDVEHTQQKLP